MNPPNEETEHLSETADGRAYLRSLMGLHGAPMVFAGGFFLLAANVAPTIGAVMLGVGVTAWVVTVLAAWVRAIRLRRGKSLFGGQSVMADANSWLGWGYIDGAAAVTGRSAGRIRHLAGVALIATVVLFIAAFSAAALR